MSDYEGLFWQRPSLSVIFGLSLFSLAGLPPLVGLMGKIYLIAAGLSSQRWSLLAALIIGSVIGIYYYVRVIVVMVRRTERETAVVPMLQTPNGILLIILSILLVGLGLYPTPLIRLITAVLPLIS